MPVDGGRRKREFDVKGDEADVFLGSPYTRLKSGGLKCPKCKRKILDSEMYCVDCFTMQPSPRLRANSIKPDVDSLFAEELAEIGPAPVDRNG